MRHLLPICLALFVVAALSAEVLGEDAKAAPTKFRVYIGTYTGKTSQGNESKGIYASELDLATGKLSEPVLMAETKSPSFLALHPDGKHLYAVGEIADETRYGIVAGDAARIPPKADPLDVAGVVDFAADGRRFGHAPIVAAKGVGKSFRSAMFR